MLRTTTTRSLPRAFERAIINKTPSLVITAARFHSLAFQKHNAVASLPKVVSASQRLRYSISGYSVKPGAPQFDKIDKDAEKNLAQEKLKEDPEGVTETSSTSRVFESAPATAGEPAVSDDELFGGIKSDLVSSHLRAA